MKREILNLFCFSFLLLAKNGLSQSSHDAMTYPSGIKHVIIVGCDGMSPNGIRTAASPVMHKLIAGGAVKWNVRTVYPSVSSPNWESMISGAGVEQHGVIDNDWGRSDYTLPPVVQGKEGLFPTIFGQIRAHYPNGEIGAAYQWEGFGRLFEKKAMNFDQHFANEDETTKGFVAYVKEKKPLFGFMHLDLVDDAGHEYGHGSDEYYQAVHKADSLIGEVFKAVQQAGIAESTLFIVTADHGGVGYGHGGATPEEMEIATIYYGRGVKKGYKIHQSVVTFDLAATIAFALGFVPPYEWTGRPVKSAFVGFNEPTNQFPGAQLIPAPVIIPAKHLYQQAGGLYFQPTAKVEITTIADDGFTRYTIDGSEPDSNSILYTKPFIINNSSVVKATSYNKAGDISTRSIAYFRLVDSTKGNGLRVQFYLGHNWNQLPLFSSLTQVAEWKSYEFALDRSQILSLVAKDDPTFAAAFTGFLEIDQDGEYTFYNSSDDGSKLYIDNKLVVNNDGDHGVIAKSGSIQLSKGRHPIRMECYNGAGGFWLDAFYKGPGVPKQLIPADKLFLKEN